MKQSLYMECVEKDGVHDAWEDSFWCQEFFAMVFDLQSNFSLGLKEKMKRKTITRFNEKKSQWTKTDYGKTIQTKRVLIQEKK